MKSCFPVIGIPGVVEVIKVTENTLAGYIVTSIVTAVAVQPFVSAFKGPEAVVIDSGSLPVHRAGSVAQLAIRRVAGLPVVRILSLVVFFQMASHTFGRGADKLAVLMTVGAPGGFMHAVEGEREVGVEGPFPTVHVVAEPAIGGELVGRVFRFVNFFVLFPVAVDTIALLTGEDSPPVTLETIHGFVNPSQGKTGGLFMIPGIGLDNFPIMGGVAVGAMYTQLQLVPVILLPVPVAGLAVGGCALHHSLEVALGAGYGSMFSDQGKIGLVVADGVPLFLLSFRSGLTGKNKQ